MKISLRYLLLMVTAIAAVIGAVNAPGAWVFCLCWGLAIVSFAVAHRGGVISP